MAGADAITLDGASLTVAGVVAVARGSAGVSIDPAALARVERGHAVMVDGIERDLPIYAVTRGTGQLWNRSVDPEERAAVVRASTRNRLVYGESFAGEVGSAALVATANGLLSGRVGVRPAHVEHMVAMLNHGIAPILPRDVGLLGIGDLGAMEQLTAALVGDGVAEHRGQRVASRAAHAAAGIEPQELQAPEATVMSGTNGVSLGLGALVLAELLELAALLDVSAALALEGYAANLSIVRPEVSAACPLEGHRLVAERLRRLLAGGDRDAPRTLQDPLSFRCVPQVHGALADALRFAVEGHEVLLNAALVNPMVVEDGGGAIFSHGNFDFTRVSLGFDMVRIALGEVAHMAVERIQKQMWPAFSGLPTGLDPSQGLGRGVNELGRFAAQLAAEVRRRANPTSGTMTVALADGINDHMTGTPVGILATREAADALGRLLALELIVSAQAVELRDPGRLGDGTRRTFAFVRETIPFLTARKDWAPDLDAFAERVQAELVPHMREVLDAVPGAQA